MSKYRIELTEKQLQALKVACEVCARFKIGQPGIAVDLLTITDGAGRGIGSYELGHQLDALIKPLMGLNMNASYGVGKFDVADVLFDLHEVFRHRLAWDKALADGLTAPGAPRKWPEMMTVDYDEPMRWGTEPLAEVTAISETQTRAKYAPVGGSVTDRPVPRSSEEPLSDSAADWYGGSCRIAESMTESAAKELSTLLGRKYCGRSKK